MNITSTVVEGADIEKFIEAKLLPAIAGSNLDLASAAMIHVILASMLPDITAPQIREATEQIAAYIITVIAGIADGPTASVN